MSDSLYIHIRDAEQLSWASLKSGSQRPELVRRGSWQDLPEVAEDTSVTVFVPATEVLLTRVELPSRNRRQVLRAAPYALEDQLIEDVELQHVAVGDSDGEGRTGVAVIARERLDAWLAQLRQRGIEPDRLVSEAQAVPRSFAGTPGQGWSLLQLPQRVVLRTAQSGYGLDAANLPVFVEQLLAAEGRPGGLDVIGCDAAAPDLPALLPATRHDCPGDALVSLIDGIRQEPAAINLLQGSYQRKRALLSGTRRWWPAVAMLAIWLVLEVGIVASQTWQLASEEQALRAEVDATYLAAVPGAKRVVNARVQMQQELDRLRGAGDEESFIALLGSAGRLFAQIEGLTLQSIAWRDGEIDVALLLTDLQELDRLRQGLLEQAGLQVDVQSATPKDKQVEARLRIRRQS